MPTDPVASDGAHDVRADLEARLRVALAETERLSVADDHGTGERTARLAGLGSWEGEVKRLRRLLDAESGGRTHAG